MSEYLVTIKAKFDIAVDAESEEEDKYGDVYLIVHAPEIDNAPTLNVQPVIHAEWENVNPVEIPLYRCSACGRTPTVIKTNFCPDCGAKMGG